VVRWGAGAAAGVRRQRSTGRVLTGRGVLAVSWVDGWLTRGWRGGPCRTRGPPLARTAVVCVAGTV